MINGVGIRSMDESLDSLSDMTSDVVPISESEFRTRLAMLQENLRQHDVTAIYLNAGTNLYYFTGLQWRPSERMVAAIVPAEGDPCYIAPRFELDTLCDHWLMEGEILAWEEHESPFSLVSKVLDRSGQQHRRLLLDEATPYFLAHGLIQACEQTDFDNGQLVTQPIRGRKSAAEIAIIRQAHAMTMKVIQSAASILKPGISTDDVIRFLDLAHRRVGAPNGSSFGIALFGVATSFPHGVKHPQMLKDDDWVLIDTGCLLESYQSDITRTFAFGEVEDKFRSAWEVERDAQMAAFQKAAIGTTCEAVDQAARDELEKHGYGPDYQLPGLPHRTGHGCGLDIHEWPCLVRGETTLLDQGMLVSNEPMLVIPGEFGVRLEDHFYMDQDGPVWITQPCSEFDDPFNLGS